MTKKIIPYSKRDYFPPDNKLVVERDGKKKMSAGGIAIPDKAQTVATFATVIAVADNLSHIYKPGDRICYGGYYQMMLQDDADKSIVILRYPEEIMYKFVDTDATREETDEEYDDRLAEEEAVANRAKERQGKLSLVETTEQSRVVYDAPAGGGPRESA